MRYTILAATAVCCASMGVRGAVVWNESVNGDLSNVQATPSSVTLPAGVSSVLGTVGGGDTRDWLRINIPTGLQLGALTLVTYASTDAQAFMGVQAGTAFVGSVNSPSAYKGYVHFGTGATNGALPPTNLVGQDLLPLMGNTTLAAGAGGFTPPLPAGDYAFIIQQLGASTSYRFDYTVTAVPEPMAMGLPLVGGLLLRRRR